MEKNVKDFLNHIGFPIEYLLEDPVPDYQPEKCCKPNCRCIEIAIMKNGGQGVKSYACLAKIEPETALTNAKKIRA